MKKFVFTARDQQGKLTSGTEEAENADVVVNRLQLRGLLVTNIKIEAEAKSVVKPHSTLVRKAKFNHYGIKEDDLIMFGRQLATAIGSGVPLLKSMDVIAQQVSSKKFYGVVNNIKLDVESGFSFRDALAKNQKVFSNLWISMVETGEASGNLPLVLDKLAYYLESRAAFKRKIVSALVYPVILFAVASLAVIFFLVFIVPRFTEIFKSFNVELPKATKILVFLSRMLKQNFLFILLGIGAIITLIKQALKTKEGKKFFDDFILRVPLVGEFLRLREIEKFCSSMTTLLEAGVPILYALEIVERSSDNYTAKGVFRMVKQSVREGKPLIIPMEESGFFPPMVTQMVNIGEEIGELDRMFKKIASFYSEILETQVTRFSSMFEPIMILVMGLVVGGMVISMFLPIFQIANVGGGR